MHDAYGRSDGCHAQENVAVEQTSHKNRGGEICPLTDIAPVAREEKMTHWMNGNSMMEGWGGALLLLVLVLGVAALTKYLLLDKRP
jgi:hypothetical protein